MSIRFSFRRYAKATSSSWTISAATRALACATLLYLPPYSPDFNPIEMAFSKLKALLRKAAERTVDALWDRIAAVLEEFTPQECANFFAAAEYEPV
jgi:transposase